MDFEKEWERILPIGLAGTTIDIGEIHLEKVYCIMLFRSRGYGQRCNHPVPYTLTELFRRGARDLIANKKL